ncbi:MAG TPA: DUF6519 domain-containing protein [Acidimicrobiales bacterium]|nr:DUF6519 domain-containing protein [Acidimicrobiales bacterium]
MGSDRARVSYDKTRQYRAVVAQQGRVALEADTNEGWTIGAEEAREEALDFVGPVGTPDDGYALSPTGGGTYDFVIGPGTMYVGGVRTSLADFVKYSAQDEWLDRDGDPDWVPVSPPADHGSASELIYEELREVEVSATEDHALREVALGGPDTSQRSRLVQRTKRFATDARTCSAALDDLAAHWLQRGLQFDPGTMRLRSSATLKASYPPVPAPADPCEPDAQNGYLGADNQLIRVQIASWDEANHRGTLLWGFDGASFLYRVTVVNPNLVRLLSRPPDDAHQPRPNQAVEVLRTAARLSPAEPGNVVASPTGAVFTLTGAYVPDTQQVALPGGGLPAAYLDGAKTPAVFLRVWEQALPFTRGTAVPLGGTGLRVTLDITGAGTFSPGDYWLVAVRPSTPELVYPHRFLDVPQPPDGPRLWAFPLGVVDFVPRPTGTDKVVMTVLEDCRNRFEGLVELTRRRDTGCCDVVVRAEDLDDTRTLQTVLDRFADREAVTICLKPGRYELRAPLKLGPEHSNFTIEACHDGAVLAAAPGTADRFGEGLVVLNRANNVTLRGLRFLLPQVRLRAADHLTTAAGMRRAAGDQFANFNISIGIRPVHCAVLTVESCLFRFSVEPERDCFSAGIFAASECWGHVVRNNRFIRDEDALRVDESPVRLLYGYLLTSSLFRTARQDYVEPCLLQDASFQDNRFEGLAGAVLVQGELGLIELESNTVRDCINGFVFLTDAAAAAPVITRSVVVLAHQQDEAKELQSGIVSPLQSPVAKLGTQLARAYTLPADYTKAGIAVDDEVGAKAEEAVLAAYQHFFDSTLSAGPPRAATDEAAAGGKKLGPASGPPEYDCLYRSRAMAKNESLDSRLVRASRVVFGGFRRHGLRLSLRVTGNDVASLLEDGESGSSLLVYGERGQPGNLTMVGGRFRNRSPHSVTVGAFLVDTCAVAGNVVVNETGVSIFLLPGSGGIAARGKETVAVTGNVFEGRTQLPPRPGALPPPMNQWNSYNAVV